jgi:hypothetical protein
MKLVWALLLAAITTVSCKKQIDELPEETGTGANTFGAKINGELWGPLKFGVAATTPILEAHFAGNNSFRVVARNFGSSPKESEMEIYLHNITEAGTYTLNQTTAIFPRASASYAYYVERKFHPTNEWITTLQYTGMVTLTRLDIPAKIIAGRFEFRAINSGATPEPITVTEGRFDVQIQ